MQGPRVLPQGWEEIPEGALGLLWVPRRRTHLGSLANTQLSGGRDECFVISPSRFLQISLRSALCCFLFSSSEQRLWGPRDHSHTQVRGCTVTLLLKEKWILFFLVFCVFKAAPEAYGGSQARGWMVLQLPAYTTAHGNAGSLTYRVRPGIEPATSRFLVGFVSTAPGQELPKNWFPFLFKCLWQQLGMARNWCLSKQKQKLYDPAKLFRPPLLRWYHSTAGFWAALFFKTSLRR